MKIRPAVTEDREFILGLADRLVEQGYAMLTLNVFTANRRARDLYADLGFAEEWIRCLKRL